jgi:hypothetical protein
MDSFVFDFQAPSAPQPSTHTAPTYNHGSSEGRFYGWTKEQVFSQLQLSEEDYKECQRFLKGVLIENGLLGENFNETSSTERIQQSLTKILEATDHSKVPRAILNGLASFDGMTALVILSLKINKHYVRERDRRSRRKVKRRVRRAPEMGDSRCQTQDNSDLQLSDEEYKECQDFLKGFLTESGLLGKKLGNGGRRRITSALRETLRTKAPNEVPRAILHLSASPLGMFQLVEISIKINKSYVRHSKKPNRSGLTKLLHRFTRFSIR